MEIQKQTKSILWAIGLTAIAVYSFAVTGAAVGLPNPSEALLKNALWIRGFLAGMGVACVVTHDDRLFRIALAVAIGGGLGWIVGKL